jgi:hypothetical protein
MLIIGNCVEYQLGSNLILSKMIIDNAFMIFPAEHWAMFQSSFEGNDNKRLLISKNFHTGLTDIFIETIK